MAKAKKDSKASEAAQEASGQAEPKPKGEAPKAKPKALPTVRVAYDGVLKEVHGIKAEAKYGKLLVRKPDGRESEVLVAPNVSGCCELVPAYDEHLRPCKAWVLRDSHSDSGWELLKVLA